MKLDGDSKRDLLLDDLLNLFEEMKDHLDHCGYGDSYERECSEDLQRDVDTMHERILRETTA